MHPRRGWEPPEVFDEYRLMRPIGRGGMGQVYLGHDVLLDRPVAVKFIAAMEPDAQARQRFLIEARAIARLQHPNVVAIYRVGEVGGRPFLVSEFVRGTSLNRIPKPMPWSQVLHIGLGLARGLGAAHRQGVLHRDIKPANVIRTDDDEVKLLDFGLAKLVGLLPAAPESGPAPPPGPAARATPEPELSVVRTRSAQALLGGRSQVLPAGAVAPPAASRETPGGSATPPAATTPAPMSLPLSGAGSVIGTPLYMAPETLQGQPASRRSDVYSLGAVLYELCTGRPPRQDVESGGVSASPTQSGPTPDELPSETAYTPLEQAVPGLDGRFAQVVDRCLSPRPEDRYASGDELRDALELLLPRGHSPVIPDGNPYRGLLAFEAEHRDLFFGRGPEVRGLLERLRGESLLLVAGDSGVGKSSLCRAGVLPLVADGALEEGRTYAILRMVPGKHPLAALCAVLAPWLAVPEEALRRKLEGEPAAVLRAMRRRQGPQAGTLLFVDQMEELVTQSDEAEARHFGQFLGTLGTPVPGVRVLMTARSDFLGRLALVPGLADELLRILYILRPLSPEGIREAIVGPAGRKGVSFESEAVVDTLVETAIAAPGGLPLLQFALAELWEARDSARKLIPATALQAIGGAPRALARYADGVLSGLSPDQRQTARRVMTRLVSAAGTRLRRTQGELGRGDRGTQAVLEALVRSRLLVASQADGATVYEVAHEALLQGWDTLRHWLEADLDDRALRQRLEAAATDWERHGRAMDLLWGERQVREAGRLDEAELHDKEAAFLRASQRRLRRQRQSRLGVLLGLPALVLLSLLSLRVKAHRDQRQSLASLLEPAQVALREARQASGRAMAARQQAFQLFDGVASPQCPSCDASQRNEAAERLYGSALQEERAAERSFVEATRRLETAVMLDVDTAEVRRLLAQVIYERIQLTQRLYRTEQQAELVQRLEAYDVDGSRMEHLRRQARLRVRVSPAQGRLTVQRYEGTGRLVLGPPLRAMDVQAENELLLEAGSYLLTVRAPGRTEVVLPVRLDPGEVLEEALALPPSRSVPAGFVYVPPGRFLFGSKEEEGLRKGFLHAQPMHPVRTGAYLIARTEVTFADWLMYLRALPEDERARRMPQTSDILGGLRLSGSPAGGFVLQMQPSTKAYQVQEGELLHYGARSQRATQDWLRFPVAGVSFEDAQAYAAWLDRTGQVPGARLCDEHEWERAARGADGRLHPHGDVLLPDDANFDETYARQPLGYGPDEVGAHPASLSPFGAADMAGNVWEWTHAVGDPGVAVYKGGGWFQGEMTNRTSNREVVQNTFRSSQIGLRLCASAKSPT